MFDKVANPPLTMESDMFPRRRVVLRGSLPRAGPVGRSPPRGGRVSCISTLIVVRLIVERPLTLISVGLRLVSCFYVNFAHAQCFIIVFSSRDL